LQAYRHRRIIQLPQSVHFSSQNSLNEAARAIGSHGRFTLLVRDRSSLHIAQKHFDCDVRLCPDMAFGIGRIHSPAPPVDRILCLIREDREKKADAPAREALARLGPVCDWITAEPDL